MASSADAMGAVGYLTLEILQVTTTVAVISFLSSEIGSAKV